MQGGTRKSNFHRSLVSSVCLLPGSLGCWEDQVISLVGKCFQELRTRGHAGWAVVPESLAFWGRAGSWLPSQPITILLLAPLSSLAPGSLAQRYRLLPCIYFPATSLTSIPVALENSVWGYSLSSVSYPIAQCFTVMSSQNIKNWYELSTLNLVNLPNFPALINSANPPWVISEPPS